MMSSSGPRRGLLAPGRHSGGKDEAIEAELWLRTVDKFGDIRILQVLRAKFQHVGATLVGEIKVV